MSQTEVSVCGLYIFSPLESELRCGTLSPRTFVGDWSVLGWAACPGNLLPPTELSPEAGKAGLGGPPADPNSSFSWNEAELASDATVQGVCPSLLSCAGHREHTQPAQGTLMSLTTFTAGLCPSSCHQRTKQIQLSLYLLEQPHLEVTPNWVTDK